MQPQTDEKNEAEKTDFELVAVETGSDQENVSVKSWLDTSTVATDNLNDGKSEETSVPATPSEV